MVAWPDADDELIARHVRLWPGDTPERAWLADSGVDVWAIIGYLRASSVEETARDYGISPVAVEAARAYYARHREVIDAWLALNEAEPATGSR
jgi:uncharacterized protein (DUF433 family)